MTGRDEHTPDEPAVWEELIASFHERVELAVPPWPAAEDLDDEDEPHGDPRTGRLPRPADAEQIESGVGDTSLADSGFAGANRAESVMERGAVDDSVAVDPVFYGSAELDLSTDEEHFVPPPPLPLPELDTVQKLGWLGLIGGPVFLILSFALNWSVPGWSTALAAAAGAGGFVTLVARIQDRDDDDPHGGAVV